MWPLSSSKRTKNETLGSATITEVELTSTAYLRWLRAGRPDFRWFLAQAEDVQETLAKLGDDYIQDVAIAIGYACQDPALAEAGIEDDAESDGVIARRAAQAVIARLVGAQQTADVGPGTRPAAKRETFVGRAERQTPAKPGGPAPKLMGKEAARS